jgi:hypothetical protein
MISVFKNNGRQEIGNYRRVSRHQQHRKYPLKGDPGGSCIVNP